MIWRKKIATVFSQKLRQINVLLKNFTINWFDSLLRHFHEKPEKWRFSTEIATIRTARDTRTIRVIASLYSNSLQCETIPNLLDRENKIAIFQDLVGEFIYISQQDFSMQMQKMVVGY